MAYTLSATTEKNRNMPNATTRMTPRPSAVSHHSEPEVFTRIRKTTVARIPIPAAAKLSIPSKPELARHSCFNNRENI